MVYFDVECAFEAAPDGAAASTVATELTAIKPATDANPTVRRDKPALPFLLII